MLINFAAEQSRHSRFGIVALIVGALTALAAAFALFSRSTPPKDMQRNEYDEWEESLGI